MSYCTCLKLCMLLSASSRWAISSCNLQRQTKRAGTLIFYSSSHYWDSSSLIRKKTKKKTAFSASKKRSGLSCLTSTLRMRAFLMEDLTQTQSCSSTSGSAPLRSAWHIFMRGKVRKVKFVFRSI